MNYNNGPKWKRCGQDDCHCTHTECTKGFLDGPDGMETYYPMAVLDDDGNVTDQGPAYSRAVRCPICVQFRPLKDEKRQQQALDQAQTHKADERQSAQSELGGLWS